jgi:hypothetical protein
MANFWKIFDRIRLRANTADPSSLVDGEAWYNSTSNSFKFRQNGATTELSTGIVLPITNRTANVTLTNYNELNTCDASGGAFTITLPTASGQSGKLLKFIRTDQTLANQIIIDGSGSETIDGNLTRRLSTQWERMEIVSNGTNWIIVSRDHAKEAVTYTPTVYGTTTNPTKGTGGAETAYWRRDGDCIEIHYSFTQSVAGADGSGSYIWSLPSGLTIDGNKIAKASLSEDGCCGSAVFRANASTSQSTGIIEVYDDGGGKAGIVILGTPEGGANLVVIGSGTYGFGTNGTARYSFDARVPVTGWE